MALADLTKIKADRVIGIDASTNSLAFAVFEKGKPVECGEVKFNGASVFERLADAKVKTRVLVDAGILKADLIAIESAVMVNKNIQVAIDLAYVYGAIIGELMVSNPEVVKVAPISWQSGIGNSNLTKQEKAKLQTDNPGKSDSWYKKAGRDLRKQRTLTIARNYFNIADGSDNVGDAVGLALFTSKNLARPKS